jgi:catechol 2,3-dioxygenase-like lactoylglutathione lyase family enzyme
MLRKIDRVILRVQSLPGAVAYYRDLLGLALVREELHVASFKLTDGSTELVLHDDPDLPTEAIYYLVDDVRDLYRRRAALKLKFANPPSQVSHGYRAAVKDPFGNVLLILDKSTEPGAGTVVEDAKTAGSLFAGIEPRAAVRREALIRVYEKVGRTADDLPYTPHFETLYADYAAGFPDARPGRAEVWRHLLNLRKGSKLPKLGESRSPAPEVSAEDRARLREMLGDAIGKRDRLPYSPRFEQLVNDFNRTQTRALSPHLVWRLVATLAK